MPENDTTVPSHTTPHHHGPTPVPSLGDANKSHFNTNASQYDKHPTRLVLAQKSANAILAEAKKHSLLDSEKTRVLDFACGTGLVSQHIASHVKFILGVDTSEGMIKEFNMKCFNQGIKPDEMKAVCVDLTTGNDSLSSEQLLAKLGGSSAPPDPFDFIICSQAFHHITDVSAIIKILALLLKPNGYLFVVDLINHPEYSDKFHHKSAHHTVAHKGGFTLDEIKQAFAAHDTLLTDCKAEQAFSFPKKVEPENEEINFGFFLASAKRQS